MEGHFLTATIAEELAKQHKEISIAEFFERNKNSSNVDIYKGSCG
jgi:hypothetical protein